MSGFEMDDGGLADELRRLSRVRFDAVVVKNMTEIYNRGNFPYFSKAAGPYMGTPVSTDETRPPIGGHPQPHGELRESLTQSPMDTVGYTKDYAPHVEFGHRTNGGGWVPGQGFLKGNVEAQRPIFVEDLRRQLRGF